MEEHAIEDRGAAWMLAWRSGDEAAFDRLVEAYSGQVYALVTRFLGHHPGREDLVQEVFLRVVRSRDRYQPSARFTTWLYRIVFNLCVNETERSYGRDALSLDAGGPSEDGDGPRQLAEAGAEDPAGSAQREDVVRLVRGAIAALPEKQRMALILAKYHELPYVEIATVLGSSEKAIKSLIHRARESLRASLAGLLAGDLA